MTNQGYEGFERWDLTNVAPKFVFETNDIVAGDFDRVLFGTKDLLADTYTSVDMLPVGTTVKTFIGRIGPEGTVMNPPNPPLASPAVYTLAVTNPGGPATLNFNLVQNVSGGTEFAISMQGGTVTAVSNCTTLTPSLLIGSVSIYAGTQFVEDFENSWPAPTPGLV